MYLVKRSKTALGSMTPVVHWATSIASEGNVTSWIADRSHAKQFTEDEVEKIEAYYTGRENAGVVEAEPVESATVTEPPKPKRGRPRKVEPEIVSEPTLEAITGE